jgi:RNA polymerase sigma factor (sigma-70 family)
VSLDITHEINIRGAAADYSALSLPTTFASIFKLKAAGVRFVDSPEFHDREAAQRIDTGPELRKDDSKQKDFSHPFLRDLSRYPLLTGEQEVTLFRKYNYLKYLMSSELDKLPAEVSPSEIDRLAKIEELWTNSQSVRDVLLLSNLRLVTSVARQMFRGTIALEELWSLGADTILTGAIEKFDYTRAYRFSSYAVPALRRVFGTTCKRDLARISRVVQIHDSPLSAYSESSTAREKLATQAASLVKELLPKLADKREQEILLLRYGLGHGSEPLTLEEIATLVGLSRQRVQQIEADALQRLQTMLVLHRSIDELPDSGIPVDLLDRRLAAYHTQPRGLDTLKRYVLGALKGGSQTHHELMRLVKGKDRNAMRLAVADLLHQGEIETVLSVEGKRKTAAQTKYQLAERLAQE